MKNLLKIIFFKFVSIFKLEQFIYAKTSFSQEGEDMIIRRFLDVKKKGFYIDVGAHHPFRFSNTYFFYRHGWRGINIDPLPHAMDLFKACRPRDINLNLGISSQSGSMSYYMFNEPAFNTFDAALALTRQTGIYKLLGKKLVPVMPLSSILERYEAEFKDIDFLSVDVEGHDLEVLRSNDWNRFRPRLVLVECLATPSIQDVVHSDVHSFMQDNGYTMVAKSLYSCFFFDGSNA